MTESSADVVIVSMPWDFVGFPSIQVGLLKALLREKGIACSARFFHLAWLDCVARLAPDLGFTIGDYREISENLTSCALGDWIFSKGAGSDSSESAYLEGSGVPSAFVSKALRLRELVDVFLDECLLNLRASGARVVGFTLTFGQTRASLALADRLKRANPKIITVFGGTNCDGPMGEALHRGFPQVDFVVRGEAEGVASQFVQEVLAGLPATPFPGLCYRGVEGPVSVPLGPPVVDMATSPTPDYDDYFAQLAQCSFRHELLHKVTLLFESARGCWWGQKNHCTFCGLEPRTMAFRAKSAERVYAELMSQAARHGILRFTATDNIMDRGYLKTLLPLLVAAELDLSLMYETKANLRREELAVMRAAGVRVIQPGIESLSQPILELMKKGTTPLINIRLLKWCAEFGIHVAWNLIYGFPREPAEAYPAMAELGLSLTHLAPPKLNRLHLDRFSPYFQSPAAHGLELLGAAEPYRHLYPELDASARDQLAYRFEYRHLDGREPEGYVGQLRELVDTWNQRGGPANGSLLRYERGPGFLLVMDSRPGLDSAQYRFDQTEASIYLACDAGATPEEVRDELGDATVNASDVREFLDGLVADRLVYAERGRYLSLALPVESRSRQPGAWQATHQGAGR